LDRGIWITWYDLPDAGRDAYLSWLHQVYMPWLLQRPGYLWAAHYASIEKGDVRRHTDDPSVPAGTRYLLLVGAEHAHVFGTPGPSRLAAELLPEGRQLIGLRQGERVNLMAEVTRIEGPRSALYDSSRGLGPCIQLGSFNCAWQHEEEMLAWYAQARMPAMATTPGGGIRIRKLASIAGWAKHAILYEFESVAARNEYFAAHQHLPDMKPWLDWVGQWLVHAPGSSSLAQRLWPPVAN